MRAVAPSSPSGGAGAGSSGAGSIGSSRGAGVTTNSGSPERRRSSTAPGGSGQALDERAGILAAGVGGHRELAAEVLDVLGQVHDASMAP